MFLWAARRLCGLTLRELGAEAGGGAGGSRAMNVSAVSKAIRRLKQRAGHDESLRAMRAQLIEMSNVQPCPLSPQSRFMTIAPLHG